jgi:hypothetical protein
MILFHFNVMNEIRRFLILASNSSVFELCFVTIFDLIVNKDWEDVIFEAFLGLDSSFFG